MAKVSTYPRETNPAYNDLLYLVHDPSSPLSKTVEIANLSKALGWVDVRAYATLALANTAAYDAEKTLLITEECILPANTTLTASTMVIKGGKFTKASTYTLTINGPFEAGHDDQVFFGFDAGDVTFGSGSVKEVYPEWWGENTTPGTTDMATMVDSAVASLTAGDVILQSYTYLLGTVSTRPGSDESYIVPKSGINIKGKGPTSKLQVKANENPAKEWNVIYSTTLLLQDAEFSNFTIDASNNLLGGGDPVRANTFIGSSAGAYNVKIHDMVFSNAPGNNTVGFSGTSGTRGRIEIYNNKFLEVGSGITGNVCTDHTDVYLLGQHNKVVGNHFESTNTVTGAMCELHGDQGRFSGNYGKSYHAGAYIASVEESLTITIIESNKLETVYYPIYFASAGAYHPGEVIFRNNYASLHASATVGSSFIYGPDIVAGVCDVLRIENNILIGNSGITFHAISPIYTKDLYIVNNTIKNFSRGITLASSALLGDGYGHHRIDILNNNFYGMVSSPIYGAVGGKVKVLNIKGNSFYADAATGQVAINLDCDPDGGQISGNTVDGNHNYDLNLGSTMDTVQLNHWLGTTNGIVVNEDYCSKGSMLHSVGSAIIKYKFGVGAGDWKSVDYSI